MVDIRQSTGIRKKLAEHRARLCLLGLKEIQRYWKINNNVLDLFFTYMDDAMAQKLIDEDNTGGQSTANSVPRPAQSSMPQSNPAPQINSHQQMQSGVTDLAGTFQADDILNLPFSWTMDNLPTDFEFLVNSEAQMTSEVDMQDIYMLQRCL